MFMQLCNILTQETHHYSQIPRLNYAFTTRILNFPETFAYLVGES